MILISSFFVLSACSKGIPANEGSGDIAKRFTKEELKQAKEDIKNAKDQGALLYTLLINKETADTTTCTTDSYKALASKDTTGTTDLAKEKSIPSYYILNQFMTADNYATLNVAEDECLEMAFQAKDASSRQEMRKLVSADIKTSIEEREYGSQIPGDLQITDCESLKIILTDNGIPSDRVAVAYDKCLEIQEKSQDTTNENEEYNNSNDSSACNIEPEVACDYVFTIPAYIQLAKNHVTPNDATVKEYASKFQSLEGIYTAAAMDIWQSDDSLFGCGDYFQDPSYHISTSPKLNSNYYCSADKNSDYEYKTGDCDDQGLDFVSTAIASGYVDSNNIRTALGIVYDPNSGNGGGHLFAEYWTGNEWIPVDPTWGSICYSERNCYIATEDDVYPWDIFKYEDYYVIEEYYGVANNQSYCDVTYDETGKATWDCVNAPDYWAQGSVSNIADW